jgi:hypothetical protein
MTVRTLQLFALLLFAAQAVSSQSGGKTDKPQLKQFFEHKKVILRIDMPADQSGVDLTPENSVMADDSVTAKRKKDFGIALKKGDSPSITKVTIGANRIGFQLNGGGYDLPPRPAPPGPSVESPSEIDLKAKIKVSTGSKRQHYVESYNYAKAQRMGEHTEKQEKYDADFNYYNSYKQQGRLKKGSRFTLKFSQIKASSVIPEDLMKWLGDYVDFSPIINGFLREPRINKQVKNPADGRIRPYFGKWLNNKGESLWIESGTLFLNSVTVKYREVCRMAAEHIFAIETVESLVGKPRFITLKISDPEVELTFYYTQEDLNNGTNSVQKETWSRH